jgi:hypothetical protein
MSEIKKLVCSDPAVRERIRVGRQNNGQSYPETHQMSEEGLKSLRAAAASGKNWRGGSVGDDFAAVLCPAGFTREYHFTHTPGIQGGGGRFVLDFAHVEGRVNIELDGPMHLASHDEDTRRDAKLRELGWRVIRIKHS